MTFNFEPGDGSFEAYLHKDEPIKQEWNQTGVTIWRLQEDGSYHEVKGYNEILTSLEDLK